MSISTPGEHSHARYKYNSNLINVTVNLISCNASAETPQEVPSLLQNEERIYQRPLAKCIQKIQQPLPLRNAEICRRSKPANHPWSIASCNINISERFRLEAEKHEHWLDVWPSATEANDQKRKCPNVSCG